MANIDSCTSIAENRQKYAKYFDEESSGTGQYNVDMFYKLLLAEMSNQDPLEPTSNTEFVSQMASFTSLQNQQDTLHYSTNNYASSLVGKTVIVASSSGTNIKTDTGVVTSLNLSGDSAEITVNGKKYKLSNVMEIVSGGTTATSAQSSSAGAFATSLIGKKVSVTATNSKGEVIAEQGVVSAVQSKDGEFSIVIDDIAYPITSVVKVENETAAAKTDTDTETPATVDETDETEASAESGTAASDDDSGETTTTTDTNVTTNGDTTTTTTTTVTRDADGKIIDTDTTVSTQQTPDYTDTDEADILDIEDSTTDDSELQELFS